MSNLIAVDTFGVLSNTYTGAPPDETHILQSPNGTLWTLKADGTTGDMTVTDGATGTVETLTLIDANNTAWLVAVDDTGILTVQSFDGSIVLAPAVNAPLKIGDAPARGYQLIAYQAGTLTGLTTYKNGSFVAQQPVPILLNDFGLPTDPIFLVVGQAYKFVLLDPNNMEVYTWDNVIGGIPFNLSAPTEFLSAVKVVFVDPSTFTVIGDQRKAFQIGRRVQGIGSSTLYGTVSLSTFDGTQTTVTVLLDSGSFDNSLSTVAVSLENPSSSAIPDRRSVGISTILSGPLTVPTASGVNLIPAGLIALLHAVPAGWLACDGSSVLRATYPNLFAAIGTIFGSVDGTHFTLPTVAGPTSLTYCIYAQA